jgi:hypothetical protein
MRKLVLIITVAFSVFSCNKNPESYIQHIEGYWEIADVSKNNKSVKSYTISTSVDYFKVNDDLTGFRKKVAPSLDGKFTVTQHESPFVLKIKNNELLIYYTVNNITFKETIDSASENELVITNADGFEYTYKPFEKLTLD